MLSKVKVRKVKNRLIGCPKFQCPATTQIRTGTKKDVGVILQLIPNTGLGVPSREISNAASPRQ